MSARNGPLGLPRGLAGGIFGAAGTFPLLSLVAEWARRLGHVPELPGAERLAGDVKMATFAEIGFAVMVLPAIGVVWGILVPRLCERAEPAGRLSFEWSTLGTFAGFILWREGFGAPAAFAFGVVLAALGAAGIILFRRRFRLRRLFARRSRRSAGAILLGGWCWETARLAEPGARPLARNHPVFDIALAGFLFLILSLVVAYFSRRGVDRLQRAGDNAWVAVVCAAVAILVPRLAPLLLIGSLALVPAGGLAPTARPWLLPGLLLFLLCASINLFYQPASPVNLFEDGHSLAFAATYLSGGAPYRDTYPVHGWLIDGGLDSVIFRGLGASLRVFRFRQALFGALGVAALAGISFEVMESLAWGGLAFLFALCVCPFSSERTGPAFFAMLVLLRGMRSGRAAWIAAGAAVAAASLFYAVDWGLIVLLSGFFTLFLQGAGSRRYRPLVAFGAGAAAGALPFAALLVRSRSLGPFLSVSFVVTSRTFLDVWGLPSPPLASTFRNIGDFSGFLAAFRGRPASASSVLVILASSVGVLIADRVRRRRPDAGVVLIVVTSIVALRGAFGRAEAPHVALYEVFAGVLAAWLARRAAMAWGESPLPLVGLTGFLLLSLKPWATLGEEVSALTTARRARETQWAVAVPIGGGDRLPADQAIPLGQLRTALDSVLRPTDTFVDFANAPSLYFLLGRRMPLPYLAPHFYEPVAAQRAVVARLDRLRPPAALLPVSPRKIAFDRVLNDERAPLVAVYIATHYQPGPRVGPFVLCWRRGGI